MRGKIEFKKWLKWLLSVLWNFVCRPIRIIAYPQYLLFVIETLFCFAIIWLSVAEKSLEIVSIWNVLRIIFILVCFFGALYRIWIYKDVNYSGIFKDPEEIKKQKLNYIEGGARFLTNPFRWFEENFQYYFIFLVVFFIICSLKESGHPHINGYGIIFGLLLVICETVINVFAKSPFLFILIIAGLTAIMNSIGNEGALFDWSFLTLIFATTIGANFYDKFLVKNRFSKEITEENLIIRKTLYYIGIIFLYLWMLLTEFVLTSTYYTIITSDEDSVMKFLQRFLIKGVFALLLLFIYKGTRVKLLYLIFKYYFRDKKSKIREFLVPISLEKRKWVVGKKDILSRNLNELERISINTYRSKEDKNKYFVEKTSEIHNGFEYFDIEKGYNSLGVVSNTTKIYITLLLCLLLGFYHKDYIRKIDDGIYKIEERSDKAEVSNEIEVLGDAVVYNGKVEAFDRRTQSFEHGTISIRKKDKHSIELTKNVGAKTKVVYQKMDANGIPIKLQEKYTGHSENPGYDGLIFSEGNSTLIFDKKDNKITNKTENHTEPFVVIPEDKLDGEAKVAFNKHKSEYKGAHFIFTANKKYDKDSSNVYVAVLSDGGKTIQINELEYSRKDDDSLYRFTGKAE